MSRLSLALLLAEACAGSSLAAQTPAAPPDPTYGLRLNAGRHFGEFGRKDHFGPWMGYGVGLERLLDRGDHAIQQRVDFSYHQARELTWGQDIDEKGQPLTTATTQFWVLTSGLDCQWFLSGNARHGVYVGAGGALSLVVARILQQAPTADSGPLGHLGLQVSGTVGTRFHRHLGAELRLAVAQYRHITAPSATLTLSLR